MESFAPDCMHCVIQGRVQGVGFRYFTVRKAQSLGLTGWVRNREDGHSVEAMAAGPREGLEQFRQALATGPPGAHVTSITCEWVEECPEFHRFEAKG